MDTSRYIVAASSNPHISLSTDTEPLRCKPALIKPAAEARDNSLSGREHSVASHIHFKLTPSSFQGSDYVRSSSAHLRKRKLRPAPEWERRQPGASEEKLDIKHTYWNHLTSNPRLYSLQRSSSASSLLISSPRLTSTRQVFGLPMCSSSSTFQGMSLISDHVPR